MSQSSPTIGAGKSGADYRSEDNSAKTALLNHHKGGLAPSYAEAGCLWLDDTATPWLLKMFNGADWISVSEVDATTNEAKPYINGGALADASETVKGIIGLATDAEVATGTATDKVPTVKQLADNTGVGGLVLLSTATALNSTTVEFITDINTTYDEYEIHIIDLVSASNALVYLRASEDEGTSYKSGTSDYYYNTRRWQGSSTGSVSATANRIQLTGLGNSLGNPLSGIVRIYNPTGTTDHKIFMHDISWEDNAGAVVVREAGSGLYKATLNAIDAFQIFMSSGNITSGEFKLYGVKKS